VRSAADPHHDRRGEARLFLVAAATIDLIDEPTLAAVAGA
jgi:hypothetical protein